MLDPRVLRTFLMVCEEGTISAAARRLGVSQPTVSVAVAQLERSLHVSLFERGRQRIVLTPEGAALRQAAERMTAALVDAEETVRLARRGVTGPLRIGGTPGALVSLVPAAIARMNDRPPFALHVIERSDSELTKLLLRGEIDIMVVTTGLGGVSEEVEERSISRDPFALIVGRAHGDLGPRVSLRDVAHLQWVLPQAAGAFHRQIEALFISAAVPMPADVIRCDSLLTSKEIVRRTRRVTVLPRGVVASELTMGQLRALPIVDTEVTRSIGVRTFRGRRLNQLALDFLDAIRDPLQS